MRHPNGVNRLFRNVEKFRNRIPDVRLRTSGIREYLNKPYGISRKGFVKMK